MESALRNEVSLYMIQVILFVNDTDPVSRQIKGLDYTTVGNGRALLRMPVPRQPCSHLQSELNFEKL